MKRFSYFSLLIFILFSACGRIPLLAAPTSTPLPTDTPPPTASQTPLPTQTSTPTATPDVTATAAVNATLTAGDVIGDLDRVLGDTDIPYKDGHLAWKQDNSLNIEMSGPDQRYREIDEDLSAGDFILKSDVTWDATGLLLCGAIFRSEPDMAKGKQYQFLFLRFSGLPAWAIEVHEFGQFKNSPTKTKFSDALDLANGATNQFMLVVQDDHFTLYLNKARQGTYYDYSKQRAEGSFGFLGIQQSGQGNCEFENSWIWTLDSNYD
ncbi:MAG: hypothetical protein ACXW4U_16005 [Anaerolineales bacterium]